MQKTCQELMRMLTDDVYHVRLFGWEDILTSTGPLAIRDQLCSSSEYWYCTSRVENYILHRGAMLVLTSIGLALWIHPAVPLPKVSPDIESKFTITVKFIKVSGFDMPSSESGLGLPPDGECFEFGY
jgi:hypothetical protein